MIEFRLNVDVLGRTRFGYSPLAEVACSLRLLQSDSPGYVMRPWLREVGGVLTGTDLRLLRGVVPHGAWAPDFLFPWSGNPKVGIEQQLEELAELPPEAVRADLENTWQGREPSDEAKVLLADPSGARIAELIWDYWSAAIAPYWPRMRAVLEDEVAHRGRQVLAGGMYDALADLHPEVKLDGQRLLIDKPHHASGTYTEAELTLVPTVFSWPSLILAHPSPDRFELFYAARGVARVWEELSEGDYDPLGDLLGRTRARVLTRLAIPMTTTQLAKELGQSAATVNHHLSVMRRNGLLRSWRSGRTVLYQRTPVAESIITSAGETVADGAARSS